MTHRTESSRAGPFGATPFRCAPPSRILETHFPARREGKTVCFAQVSVSMRLFGGSGQ